MEQKENQIKHRETFTGRGFKEASSKTQRKDGWTDRDTHKTNGPTSEAMKPKSVNQCQNP